MSTTLTKEIRDFADIDFSFTKHPVTNNASVKNVTAIKQSIINLLTMREGDKPFHPEIQSPIYPYLFDNFSVVTQVILQDEVRKYLNVFEPRVMISDVTISTSGTNDLYCHITGEIVTIKEPFNVSILVERLR